MIKRALAQDKGDEYFRTIFFNRKRKRATLAQKGTGQGCIRSQNKEGHKTQAQTCNDIGTSNMATTPI